MISGRTDDDMTDDPAAQDRDAEPEDRGAKDLEADIAAFWSEARTRARFDWIGAYGGPTILGSLRPPAWSFGATPEEADAFLTRVLDEREEVVTTSSLADYDAEAAPLPERGAVSIVLDGAGHPRALIATAEVVVGDDQVSETFRLLYPRQAHR